MSNYQNLKDTEMKSKPRCSVCGKFKNEAPLCVCAGGSDSASESTSNDSGSVSSGISTESRTHDNSTKTTLTQEDKENSFNPLQLSSSADVLLDMLENKLLMISNNRDTGILTISLLHSSSELTSEQKFSFECLVKIVLCELNKFKEDNNLSSKSLEFKKDKSGNVQSLIITLPRPGLYDAFINRLLSHELFKQQANTSVSKAPIEYQSPRPRSILDGLKRQ